MDVQVMFCSSCGQDHETVVSCKVSRDGIEVMGEHYLCPITNDVVRVYLGTPKGEFEKSFDEAQKNTGNNVTKLVIAVKLPTGATELIINTEQIKEKVNYYLSAYAQDLRLKTNPTIQIVGYMFA